MNRKEMIKTCGYACLGGLAFGPILQSCSPLKIVSGAIEGDDLVLDLSEFKSILENEERYKKYVIVQNEILQYPICIYRISQNEYAALWMRCTHQGTELTAFGEKLQCSAHGSEFNKYGTATNGPATESLRKFPVSQKSGQLKISLKAV